ncbi:MAG TPA: hypothetical protein VFZ62_01530 [Candidatus Saccharimonadales bacterium]
MRLNFLSNLSIVRTSALREVVRAQVIALIETNPQGLRVEMSGSAQEAMPNLPAALTHQIMRLLTESDEEILDTTYASLELDEDASLLQRRAIGIALQLFPTLRRREEALYKAIVEAVDYLQILVQTQNEPGRHVCRVITWWQSENEDDESKAAA